MPNTELLDPQQTAALDHQVGVASWPTVSQAADQIGVSTRTVQNLMAQGLLRRAKRPAPGSPAIVVVHPGDVNAEASKRRTAMIPPAVEIARRAEASHPPGLTTQLLEALVEARRVPETRMPLNLTLAQAAEYSGLPRRLLMRAIRDRRLPAHAWNGAFFVNREDLENFRPAAVPALAWSGSAE